MYTKNTADMEKSSWFHTVKSIAELLGIITIVISLLLVGQELKQNRQIALADSDMVYTQNTILANQQIAQYPDIWLRGNAGDSLTSAEAVIYETLLANKNDLFILKHAQALRLKDPENAYTLSIDFIGFLHRNPGARKVWAERELLLIRNRERFGVDLAEGWYQGIKAGLEELDQQAPK